MTKDIFIRVAIPSPLRRTFDYRPPANCPVESLKPGVRVQVPFGNRRMIGIITGCSNESDFPAGKIKAADKLIDQLPVIDGHLMSLYLWAADYYQFPVGQALQTSLPAQIRNGKPAEEKQMPSWQASAAGENLIQSTLKNAPRQLQVLSLIIARKKITAAALKESISGELRASD